MDATVWPMFIDGISAFFWQVLYICRSTEASFFYVPVPYISRLQIHVHYPNKFIFVLSLEFSGRFN
jgi:hypothetical protein